MSETRDNILAVYDGIDAPYILKTKELVNTKGVTDIHLTEGDNIWYRFWGDLCETDVFVPSEGVMMISSSVFKLGTWDRGNRACSFDGKRLRLRFSRTRQKAQLFVRILPSGVPSAEAVGSLKIIKKIIPDVLAPGLFLVSGATGSGKSTFLASYMQYLLDSFPIHIVTIEDPVEYVLKNGKGHVSQREIPDDVHAYDEAVRDSLREDPDVILVGEIRDAETASAALTAAETGHLVLGTVHASSPHGVIERIIGLTAKLPDAKTRLALSLVGVVHLTLKNDGKTAVRKAISLPMNNDTARLILKDDIYSKELKTVVDYLENV